MTRCVPPAVAIFAAPTVAAILPASTTSPVPMSVTTSATWLIVAGTLVGTFAALNCFEANYEDEMPGSAALIDIGASVTSIAILHHGVSVFWRDISIGGNQYTDTLQRELNLQIGLIEIATEDAPASHAEVADCVEKALEASRKA